MNLVLGLCQRGFEVACKKHVNIAVREFQRYLQMRKCMQYITMHQSVGLPNDARLFAPKYNNVYIYVLCHTAQINNEEYLELNGPEKKIRDDVFVEWVKNFKADHVTLVLETCHSEGINDLERPTMPQDWTVINTCTKGQKSLFNGILNIGVFTGMLARIINLLKYPLFVLSPEAVVSQANSMNPFEKVVCHGDKTKWIDLPIDRAARQRIQCRHLCSN